MVNTRPIAEDEAELVMVGGALVEGTIPGHEFPRPVDRVVGTSGGGEISGGAGGAVEFFSSSTFLMVGPIPVQFGECVCDRMKFVHKKIFICFKMFCLFLFSD